MLAAKPALENKRAVTLGILFAAAVALCALTVYGAEFKVRGLNSRGFGLMSQSGDLYRFHGTESKETTWQPGTPIPWPAWAPTPYLSPTFQVEVITETPELRQWIITVNNDFDSDDVYPVPPLEARFQAFLKPESATQSDDPKIVDIASEAVKDCLWQSDAVLAIQIWISTHIRYDYTLSSDQDALTVLNRGTGTCYGHSCLAVALCRAAGIPAAVCKGIAAWGLGGNHAWITVFYPRTGWLFTEPQGTVNSLSVDHYIDWPIDAGDNWQPLPGAVSDEDTNKITSETSEIPAASDGEPCYVIAASARHIAAVSSPVGEAHIEIWPPEETFQADVPVVARAWVTGNSNLVWAAMAVNGVVVKEGPPPNVLRRQNLSCWSFRMGENVISVSAEDIAGQVFTAEKTFSVNIPPRILAWPSKRHEPCLKFSIPMGMYAELQYSRDLKEWSMHGIWRGSNSCICLQSPAHERQLFWRIVYRDE